MHVKTNPTVDNNTATSPNVKADAGNGTRHAEDATAGELNTLIADVEHLISQMADSKDTDHTRIRDKARATLLVARDSLTTRAAAAQRHARQLVKSTDDYVRGSPWQALGIAALVGATVGYLAGRRR